MGRTPGPTYVGGAHQTAQQHDGQGLQQPQVPQQQQLGQDQQAQWPGQQQVQQPPFQQTPQWQTGQPQQSVGRLQQPRRQQQQQQPQPGAGQASGGSDVSEIKSQMAMVSTGMWPRCSTRCRTGSLRWQCLRD